MKVGRSIATIGKYGRKMTIARLVVVKISFCFLNTTHVDIEFRGEGGGRGSLGC